MCPQTLLIAPLIEEVRHIIDTTLVDTGFSGHLLLGILADLFVIHQTGNQQLEIARQRVTLGLVHRRGRLCRVLIHDVIKLKRCVVVHKSSPEVKVVSVAACIVWPG